MANTNRECPFAIPPKVGLTQKLLRCEIPDGQAVDTPCRYTRTDWDGTVPATTGQWWDFPQKILQILFYIYKTSSLATVPLFHSDSAVTRATKMLRKSRRSRDTCATHLRRIPRGGAVETPWRYVENP